MHTEARAAWLLTCPITGLHLLNRNSYCIYDYVVTVEPLNITSTSPSPALSNRVGEKTASLCHSHDLIINQPIPCVGNGALPREL